ncbi:MAG: hypothetical protein ACI8TQ_001409 [Planctomycetota bacterium]|jgi:hypothetical protein
MTRFTFEFKTAAIGLSVFAAACGTSGGGAERGVIPTFSPAFLLRQDVQLGSGNVTDAIAIDFNGDGIDDVVETDYADMKISGALGNPDGSFTPIFKLDTPNSPWGLKAGDYDGDGNNDLAVICISPNGGVPSLTIYRGYGTGAFSQDSSVVLPEDPFALDSGVLAGSSFENLFVTLPGIGEVRQYELTAPGSLIETKRLLVSDASKYVPLSVAVVDANGDFLQDVVVGELSKNPLISDQIVMYLSDGFGRYDTPVVMSPISSYPLVDNIGDINGDGREDLGVAQIESDRAQFFLGSATGLSNPLEIPFNSATSSIVFADLNADGLVDVAATLIEDSAIAVRLATAPAVFGDLTVYNVGELPRAIAVGKFGAGDELDLFCSNSRDISILSGDGAGKFRGATGYPIGAEPNFIRVVDMDADGILDAVSIDRFQNKVVFMRGIGDGSFTNMGQVALAASSIEVAGYLQIHDFDEDGRPDVATTVHSTGDFRIIRNSGSLPLTAPLSSDATVIGNQPLGFDAGDLNGNGHLDVVVANSGDNTLQVLIGAGDGSFDARGAVSVPNRPLFVLIDDFNVDGDLDVAVATGDIDGTNTNLLIYSGDGAGNLALVGQRVLPQLSSLLHSGDFNEDGLPDIAASQPQIQSDEVLIMQNMGGFQFGMQHLQLGFRMGTLEVFDVNRDTHLDLVVPLRDGELMLALGDGTGNFPTILPPAGGQFPAPHKVMTSAFADVNGDNLPDLLMVSPTTPHLWVALNDGTEF